MKFEDIQEKTKKEIIESRHSFKNMKEPIDLVAENIRDIQLYENFAIYIMQPGTKGNLQEMSKLANDGENPASWACRIYLNKSNWNVQIAPHPGIDKENINFNLKEFVEEKYGDRHSVSVSGYDTVVKIKTQYKKDVEEIISSLIEELKKHKLDGIENQKIYEGYTQQPIDKNFSIGFTTVSIDKLDEQTYNKYLLMIKKMIDKGILDEDELDRLTKISKNLFEKKSLSEKMALELNDMIYNNLTQKEKIEIAMKYMQEGM